jgi:hypothetical protein
VVEPNADHRLAMQAVNVAVLRHEPAPAWVVAALQQRAMVDSIAR